MNISGEQLGEPRKREFPRLMLTVTEFCQSIAIGKTTFYELVKSGELTVIKVGRRTLIEVAELERFLAKLRKKKQFTRRVAT